MSILFVILIVISFTGLINASEYIIPNNINLPKTEYYNACLSKKLLVADIDSFSSKTNEIVSSLKHYTKPNRAWISSFQDYDFDNSAIWIEKDKLGSKISVLLRSNRDTDRIKLLALCQLPFTEAPVPKTLDNPTSPKAEIAFQPSPKQPTEPTLEETNILNELQETLEKKSSQKEEKQIKKYIYDEQIK